MSTNNEISRKGQVKMGENIAILIVFFLLVGMGLVFYWSFLRGSIQKEGQELFDLKSVEIGQKIFFLPELQCTNNNIPIEGCVDIIKAEVLGKTISDDLKERLFYSRFFGFSEIIVRDIEGWSVTVYNNSLNGTLSKTNLPILLYDPTFSRYDFGVLEITTYK